MGAEPFGLGQAGTPALLSSGQYGGKQCHTTRPPNEAKAILIRSLL